MNLYSKLVIIRGRTKRRLTTTIKMEMKKCRLVNNNLIRIWIRVLYSKDSLKTKFCQLMLKFPIQYVILIKIYRIHRGIIEKPHLKAPSDEIIALRLFQSKNQVILRNLKMMMKNSICSRQMKTWLKSGQPTRQITTISIRGNQQDLHHLSLTPRTTNGPNTWALILT